MFASTVLVLSLISIIPSLMVTGDSYMASHEMSLENRYENVYVNDVFKDNILLTLRYLEGSVAEVDKISWEEVNKPFKYEFSLKPGEEFAFHDTTLPEYTKNVVKTTNAHFNYQDGFKSDGYLFGDGVCHLASLIYWVAKDAGLEAVSPTNHNFANVPEVPKEYGVSISFRPNEIYSSARQNLYITNNKEMSVSFVFEYDGENLKVAVKEVKLI
ncbi:MAG: VanW family protein [Patescibacteria group bacterium]